MPRVKVFFITPGEQQPGFFLATSSEVTAMNSLKTTLLPTLLTILMVTTGSAIGGRAGMAFAFTMFLGMIFFLLVLRQARIEVVRDRGEPGARSSAVPGMLISKAVSCPPTARMIVGPSMLESIYLLPEVL
jgi:hypothetical protein